MRDADVLILCEDDLAVAPHVRRCVEEVRAAGTPVVVERCWCDGDPCTPGRLHLRGALTFFASSGAARVLASATGPCPDDFHLDVTHLEFLGLRGCGALLTGTRGFREHGGILWIEGPRPAVRRVLRRGMDGAPNVVVA